MSAVEPFDSPAKLGMSGTQAGMTALQRRAFGELVVELEDEFGWVELHHGDCVGADAECHSIAQALNCRIVVHPPSNPAKRAYCVGDELRQEEAYLDRNHDIVDETEMLVAFPGGPERLHSGTWATIRYAKKLGRRVLVVYPDGALERWEPRVAMGPKT